MSKHDVFATHADEQRQWLEEMLGPHLLSRGIVLWQPGTETLPGSDLRRQLPDEVRKAALCLLILSDDVLQGERYWMRYEIAAWVEQAGDNDSRLIPVFLEISPGEFRTKAGEADSQFAEAVLTLLDRVGIYVPDASAVEDLGDLIETKVEHSVRHSGTTWEFVGWLVLSVASACVYFYLLSIGKLVGVAFVGPLLFVAGRAHMSVVPRSEIGHVKPHQAKRRMSIFAAIGVLVLAGLVAIPGVVSSWWVLAPALLCLVSVPVSLACTYLEWTWFDDVRNDWRTRLFRSLGLPIDYSTTWLVPVSATLFLGTVLLLLVHS